MFIASDKAVEPLNLYGCTKLCGEKMIESANNHRGHHNTHFCFVRYGNVFGSRGSVLDVWAKQNPIEVRDFSATRFHLMPIDAVELIEKAINVPQMTKFIPHNLKSYYIGDLATCYSYITKKGRVNTKPLPDEKHHEKLAINYKSDDAIKLSTEELDILIKDHLDKAIPA